MRKTSAPRSRLARDQSICQVACIQGYRIAADTRNHQTELQLGLLSRSNSLEAFCVFDQVHVSYPQSLWTSNATINEMRLHFALCIICAVYILNFFRSWFLIWISECTDQLISAAWQRKSIQRHTNGRWRDHFAQFLHPFPCCTTLWRKSIELQSLKSKFLVDIYIVNSDQRRCSSVYSFLSTRSHPRDQSILVSSRQRTMTRLLNRGFLSHCSR